MSRASARQQLHWQIVLREIPRRMVGYRHQQLSVPTVVLAGEGDFAVATRSLTARGAPR